MAQITKSEVKKFKRKLEKTSRELETEREKFQEKKTRLKNLKKILRSNRKEAKHLVGHFFNDKIMSRDKYKLEMSNAQLVKDFIERIGKLKTTSLVSV